MNVFDQAFQHLGFPSADFTDTQRENVNGRVRCISTLIYDNITNLVPEDWENAMEEAVPYANHILNKSIDSVEIRAEVFSKTSILVTIEVYR